MKIKWRFAAVLSVLALGACTDQPPTPAANPANDVGLRQVHMASGDALAWLLPETSAQVLCQSLNRQQWQDIFGAPVRRTAGTDTCRLAAGSDVVTLSMVKAEYNWSGKATVAGHEATVGSGEVLVAATGTDLDKVQSGWPMRTLLKAEGTNEKVRGGVLDRLVPVLAAPGAKVPMPKDSSEFAYQHTQTPTPGQFLDQPLPLQVLELCSLLADQQHVAAAGLHPKTDGTCVGDEPLITLGVKKAEHPASTYSGLVGGRPAILGGSDASVRLRDDLPYDLLVSPYYGDAVKLAEPLVAGLV